jgi:uncharacterized protein (DUF2141 family)
MLMLPLILMSLNGPAGDLKAAETVSCAPAAGQSAQNGRIRIKICNLRNTSGIIGIALFTTKKGFPDKQTMAYTTTTLPASDTQCEVVFDDVPYGTYAVSILHDENNNGKMDKTFIGIPREGFGTSNNPKIRRGPPGFEESQFALDHKEVDLNISLNYF